MAHIILPETLDFHVLFDFLYLNEGRLKSFALPSQNFKQNKEAISDGLWLIYLLIPPDMHYAML